MVEFKLPDLGENIETADVSRVLVSEGDTVEAEQGIAELETEKAVFELPCPHAGKIAKLHIKEGDTISVGDVVVTLEETEAAPEVPAKKKPVREEPETVPVEVEEKEAPAEEKAEEPAPTPEEEVPERHSPVEAEEPAEERKVPEKKAPPERKPAVAEAPEKERRKAVPERKPRERHPAPAGPATRRLARELGVDLYEVAGRGPGGRITREDVKGHVRRRAAGDGRELDRRLETPELPDFSQWGPVERQPLNKIAKTTAERLSVTWHLVPHVTQHELADITELEAARKQYQEKQPESTPKVTITALLLKAAVGALKAYPKLGSSFDPSAGELIVKRYYHIGVAVDTEHGLLVPVIRDADRKSIVQLAAELSDLAEKARQRKLSMDQMRGGTFTITNLGGIGGTAFTPIINYPEVAILGVARARWEQVFPKGRPVVRFVLPLSLSYDHRVVNGADGARFVRKIAELLSHPTQLLFES